MKAIVTIIFFLAGPSLFAQSRPASFYLIDKWVKTIPVSGPDTLARQLTGMYKNDIEKVRSIFRWITENIAYDTKAYHNPEKAYEGLWQPAGSPAEPDRSKDYNARIVQKVLAERKAICDGYSRLFKTLCDYAKIKCEIITGYIRWSSDAIGEMTNRRHAWNAVYIDGGWHLVDVTWASGYSNAAVTEFTKRYDDFFFFTNPVWFFNDHYPVENKWSLLPNTPSLDQFYNFPFYYPAFYSFKIIDVKPTAGFLDVTPEKRFVHIELVTKDRAKDMYIYESPLPDVQSDSISIDSLSGEEFDNFPEVKYKIENNRISYLYEIQSGKTEKLNIVYNGKLILTYGIRFRSW
jgi:hypothetical protein